MQQIKSKPILQCNAREHGKWQLVLVYENCFLLRLLQVTLYSVIDLCMSEVSTTYPRIPYKRQAYT